MRNPGRNSLICLAITAAGVLSIWSGIAEMNAAGEETDGSALKIGIGLAVAAVGAIGLYNFLFGMKVMRNVRRGRREIARWTVTAGEFDEFRTEDAARNALGPAYRNDYTPPKRSPAGGIEVVFLEDGVSVGGTFFGLTTTGMHRFAGVQMLPRAPLAIEFGIVLTALSPKASSTRLDQIVSVLRVPLSRLAPDAAAKVFEHFRRVDAREIIVNPGFYRGRMWAGLAAATILFPIAAGGFWLNAVGADWGDVPLYMAVGGVVAGLGGLLLAFAAWLVGQKQRRRR
jgi:hypothetical protein